jgi:SM-20-related protein
MAGQLRVRGGEIDGLPARVVDGLMDTAESLKLFQAFQNSPFTRNEFARPDVQAFRHSVCNIEVQDCRRMTLYGYTMEALKRYLPEYGPHRCYRAYCNMSIYGDMLFTHTDSQPGQQELTALWYLAPQWDVEWGGETLLFNTEGDAEFAVSPRPGRLLLFDGRIRHAGRPPNRICVIPRLTFALKLEPE